MPNQYNTRISTYDMTASSDDDIGGAIVTGSLRDTDVACRFEPQLSRLDSHIQGMETERRFDVMIANTGLVINERDEIEITWPAAHPYINNRFRVSIVVHDSNPGPLGHIELVATRIVSSRSLP